MKKFFKIFILLVLLFTVQTLLAQGPPSPGDGDGNVQDVLPINFLIYPFLIIGAYIGYVFINKNTK